MKIQDAFNTIYTGLLKQNAKAFNSNNTKCAYRGSNNTKCAVGMCIPDDMYIPELDKENVSVVGIININERQVPKYISTNQLNTFKDHLTLTDVNSNTGECFWRSMQNIHDNQSIEDWSDNLISVAEEYNLTVPN